MSVVSWFVLFGMLGFVVGYLVGYGEGKSTAVSRMLIWNREYGRGDGFILSVVLDLIDVIEGKKKA